MSKYDKYVWGIFLIVSLAAYAYFEKIKYLALFIIFCAIALILKLIVAKMDAKELELREKRIDETAKLLRKQHETDV